MLYMDLDSMDTDINNSIYNIDHLPSTITDYFLKEVAYAQGESEDVVRAPLGRLFLLNRVGICVRMYLEHEV